MSAARAVGTALLVVLVLAAVGTVAGLLWEWVWDPPVGVVVDDRWVLDPAALGDSFSGTGWYVVIAAGAGLLASGALAWRLPSPELVTLAAVLGGSLLAGWVMYHVGHAAGPPDPQVLAQGRPDLTRLPGDLQVAGADERPGVFPLGSSAFVAFPGGALVGLAVVFLTTDRRGRQPRRRALR